MRGEKKLKKFSKPLIWLVSLFMVVVFASLFASLVQNSFGSVKVDKISFETENNNGTLSGYLFVPKGVDAANPAPAVVLTHGYLNNAEMQEIGAIELSRRGFVVLAFDMYDHGDSTWDTPAAFSFFPKAVYDAVQYVYDLNYVLKDDNGNGMIGVSGHSMGGFSSIYAVLFDEVDFYTNGYRKIAAALPVGADFRYVGGFPDPIAMFQTRVAGIIGAHYDQFFFDNSGTAPGSVVYKDFVKDAVGLSFLGRTDEGEAEAGVYYERDGGLRVIYTPNQTHPQNTWSLETGANTIEFFETAFEHQFDLYGLGELEDHGITAGRTGQVWWLKEAFTLIALVGLIGMIFPLFALLTKLPVFNKIYKEEASEEGQVQLSGNDNVQKTLKVMLIIITTLLAAYFLVPFMDRAATTLDNLAKAMYYVIGAAGFVTLATWVGVVIKGEDEATVKLANKITLGAVTITLVALAYRWLLINRTIITRSTYWSAPSINTILYWALAAAGLIMLTTLATAPIFNVGKNVSNPYGLKISAKQLIGTILTVVVMVVGLLFVVALVEWVFLTDFRFYTYAIKIFNSHQFAAAWRYIPLFFIYYFAAGISIFVNTKNMKAWKGDLLAAFLLAGPIVLFLIYQYFVLYNTGVAAFPTFSLSAILTVGLVPTLSFAGIILRRFSAKTGNIWAGAIFSTLFFTLITLANTTVYVIMIG